MDAHPEWPLVDRPRTTLGWSQRPSSAMPDVRKQARVTALKDPRANAHGTSPTHVDARRPSLTNSILGTSLPQLRCVASVPPRSPRRRHTRSRFGSVLCSLAHFAMWDVSKKTHVMERQRRRPACGRFPRCGTTPESEVQRSAAGIQRTPVTNHRPPLLGRAAYRTFGLVKLLCVDNLVQWDCLGSKNARPERARPT